ncbi:alpha/beta fold hydrolase [Thauera sp. SDU_THAU2]|uniref:alpha/beta fold hydrolase n=1 Tax=Thauera sp. SDU_THAU2 TaxID=3136633 RepID=UPI00311FC0C9
MSLFSELSRVFEPPTPPRRPKHGVRERRVQCIGPHGLHRMAYTEWGDADNPRVLICVHGLTRNGRDFDDLAQALADDFRVVCPDVVGRGRSDWLGVKEDYGFPLYVSDMIALIARLNAEQVDWVGTSMGGIIGMLIASLPHSPIRRLVLNDVGPVITAVSLQRIGPYVGTAPRFATMEEADAYLRKVNAPFGPLTDEQWRHLANYSVRPVGGPDGGFVMIYDPAIGEVFRATPATEDIDMWPVYERIGCPTLALRGAESDLLERSTLEAMAQRGPCAKLIEFEGVGHAPMLMDPEQIRVVGDFLKSS